MDRPTPFPSPAESTPELLRRALAAIQGRDPAGALTLLSKAQAQSPDDIDVLMNRALALRMMGDLPGAIGALDAALTLAPYHFVALLSKASLVERTAGRKHAAAIYKNALKIAPPDQALNPGLLKAVQAAREAVRAEAVALQQYLRTETQPLRSAHADAPLGRFDETLDVFAGVAKPFPQEPLLLNYARLPAIPFHDRAAFPWLAQLEAATPIILEELQAILADPPAEFGPYIKYPPGAPVNQWGELNHSRRWSAYGLWIDGVRQAEACRRCPRTAALLETLPLMDQPGFAPTATFSALEPHTHIPPHTGSSNARLLVHLPLILPGPARFRVGAETRDWRLGEAWVFDDTIEHEAWNDADEMRVILILDVWNPLLSSAERALVTQMQAAWKRYFESPTP